MRGTGNKYGTKRDKREFADKFRPPPVYSGTRVPTPSSTATPATPLHNKVKEQDNAASHTKSVIQET
jgi:hypothetical protein